MQVISFINSCKFAVKFTSNVYIFACHFSVLYVYLSWIHIKHKITEQPNPKEYVEYAAGVAGW